VKLKVFFLHIIKKIRFIFIKRNFSEKFLDAPKNNIIKSNIKDNELNTYKLKQCNDCDKEKFFQTYNQAKQDDFDVFSIDKETLSKICDMMEEELKIKQKILEEKKLELKKISE
jgi:hypothetical protein